MTYVFLSPSFHRPLDALCGINPPVLSYVGQVAQAQEVQMDKKPLDLFLCGIGLVGLEVANVEFGSIDNLSMRSLKKIEHEIQQWTQSIVFLDACRIIFLHGGRLP